ncbi:MAG TPA: hypothetical protein VKR32_14100 [Puia sp.]|nr:hypothetical protein [Puia sp.]
MTTDIFHIDGDFQILCAKADSFPAGIKEAFETITEKIGSSHYRTYYGVSRMDKNGTIIYYAGVNAADQNEASRLGCETFTIRGGDYLGTIVNDFMNDTTAIGKTFQELLKDPRLDRNGYCLEIYANQRDVKCMVPIIQANH